MQVHHANHAVTDWADGNPVHNALGTAEGSGQMVKLEAVEIANAHTSETTPSGEGNPSSGEASLTSDDKKLEWDGTSWILPQVSPHHVVDQPVPIAPKDPWVHDNLDSRKYLYPDDCSVPQHPGQKPIPPAFVRVEVSSVDLEPYLELGMIEIPVKVCLA